MTNRSSLKAEYHTLGCKLNFAEASTVGAMLAERGVRRSAEGETPDVCVVNTCSVTETADKKGRQLIKRLVRQYPEACIIVTGCYAQLKSAEIAAIPGVDIVVGANEKLRIATYLDSWLKQRQPILSVGDVTRDSRFEPSCERGDRTRYFLKIQDGCDYFCTYCTIPYARGRSRNGAIADLVRQAQDVADAGGREIVLTGVNIGDFGRSTSESFFDLLRSLDEVEGISRYRISSIEPNLLTPQIIEWVARGSRAFMPHFHIPLQSGSDAVLRLMNRRYDTALYADRVATVRELLPDAFIGVDIMTGARGETPREWEKSYRFVESLPVTRLHVFPYSERPGTAALRLPGAVTVSQEEKHRRVAQLTELSDRKLRDFMQRNTGRVRPVLWEHRHTPDTLQGLTDNYLRVSATATADLANTISQVRLETLDPDNPEMLTGTII